ncbi:MAG: polysaccharide deacetylase family protein [Acidobacteriota bacterium]|nr:polysaccharide deacetylase family protein [Acidobacteriota bacterium]
MLMITAAILAILGLAFGLWFWWACSEPSSTFFRPVLIRGPQEGKRISLTFDDGPAEQFTEQILDILRAQQVPATFFVCGKNVENHPDLLRRIVAEGHEVGNHAYSHFFVYFKSRRRIAGEIDRTQEIIEKVVGFRPRIFRPPYGARWFGLVPALVERGMHLILWSATGYDWKKDVPGIIKAALGELKPGAVILLHDGRETRRAIEIDRSRTVEALPAIIAGARKQGYTFAPLKDFLPAT